VYHAACIDKGSCDFALWIDRGGERECGTRRVERGDGAVRGAKEAVNTIARIESRDRPGWVDGDRHRECRARRIEHGEGTVRALQIAGRRPRQHSSRDRPSRIDGRGDARICVDYSKGAVGSPHETLKTRDRITEVSHNVPRWVDGEDFG